MQTVLYISYTGMTDPLGQSQVLAYIIGLSNTGNYKFLIVSFEHEERYLQNKDQVSLLCTENNITWVPLKYIKRPGLTGTIKSLRLIKATIQRLQSHHKFDLVHCRSYRASIIGMWMNRQFGSPFIFDMRGFWADERIEGKIWNLKNPVYRMVYQYFKIKEKQLLRKANHIVVLTDNAKREIHNWNLPGQPLPISVIPCCVDINLFNPGDIDTTKREQLKKQLSINDDDIVITYLGSLGTWYLLEEMLEFYSIFLKSNPNSVLLFITNEDPAMITSRAEAAGIPQQAIRIISAKRNEVPLALSLSNFSLFFIKESFSKKGSSPVKQGEIMAMGIPVICNSNVGDTDIIVSRYHSGIVVDKLDENGYNNAIKKVEETLFNANTIRQGAEEFFSLEKGVEMYHNVYQAVLNALPSDSRSN